MRRPRSLQGRLVGLVVALVGGVWLGAALFTLFDARHQIEELLDSHLAQSAALLAARHDADPPDKAGMAAPASHRYARRVAFQVWHGGRLALRSTNAPATPMASRASGFGTQRLDDGRRWRVYASPGADDGVQIYVGERMEARDDILQAVMRGMLAPLLLVLPLLAALGWWAVHHGLRPLRHLGRTLAQRAPDALQPVALPQLPTELQGLVDALNALFGRVARLLDGERRFTADAAHELRTPIAAIRAQAQVAMAACDDGVRRHALQATLDGCDRAARLVDQLLTLARLEGRAPSSGQPVALAALARAAIAELMPQAMARHQQVTLDAPDTCRVAGDATLLGVLLRNLVDNAMRYSPEGARIDVALSRGALHWTLSVDDSGPGMDDVSRTRLGERFFRVLGTEASGSGLGWSIVRRIADLHGLTLAAVPSASLGGLRVTVGGLREAAPGPAGASS